MIHIYGTRDAILTLTLYNHRHLGHVTTRFRHCTFSPYDGNLIPSIHEVGLSRANRSLSCDHDDATISQELDVKWDTKNCKKQIINPISPRARFLYPLLCSRIRIVCIEIYILSWTRRIFSKYTPFHVVHMLSYIDFETCYY